MALTFDGGANDAGAASVLATLRRSGAPATFFLSGRFVSLYPAVAREIGQHFPVGDHTVDHSDLTRLSDADGHVTEPASLYSTHIDAKFRTAADALLARVGAGNLGIVPALYPRWRTAERPLGEVDEVAGLGKLPFYDFAANQACKVFPAYRKITGIKLEQRCPTITYTIYDQDNFPHAGGATVCDLRRTPARDGFGPLRRRVARLGYRDRGARVQSGSQEFTRRYLPRDSGRDAQPVRDRLQLDESEEGRRIDAVAQVDS